MADLKLKPDLLTVSHKVLPELCVASTSLSKSSRKSKIEYVIVLLYNNLLSCHLPRMNQSQVNLSLCALGNHFRQPSPLFPDWVSSFERDGLFWTSDSEGCMLLLRLGVAIVLLQAVLMKQLGLQRAIHVVFRWRRSVGQHRLLVLVSSQVAAGMVCHTLRSVVFLMGLLHYGTLYRCPRTLALASACSPHDINTCMKSIAVAMWGHLCLHSSVTSALSGQRQYRRGQAGASGARRNFCWVVWILLTWMMSSLAVVDMGARSVPGLFHLRALWLKGISMCIGCFQGLLNSFVLPRLAGMLTPDRHAFIAISNLLLSFAFPASAVVYLDSACLGNWVTWWEECSPSRILQ